MEDRVPGYRLRLFLSVDIAGSTAYKNGAGADPEGTSPYPIWVERTRAFYRDFPALVESQYRELSNRAAQSLSEGHPRLWKTVGDEILLCCRLTSIEHSYVCVASFREALRIYGLQLDGEDGAKRHLDVKGAAWVADFPVGNVTVPRDQRIYTRPSYDEELERSADHSPHEYEFLGKSMDCGFRVASKSATNGLVLSVELAAMLAHNAVEKGNQGFTFGYQGKFPLKGVIRDRPYPIVSIDTERRPSRRQVIAAEARLTGHGERTANDIADFLRHFMDDEGIPKPMLEASPVTSTTASDQYTKFRDRWLAEEGEREKQDQIAEQSARTDQAGGGALPDEVTGSLGAASEVASP